MDGCKIEEIDNECSRAHQVSPAILHVSFINQSNFPFTTACYHAKQHVAFKKTLCRSVHTMEVGLSTSTLPPVGLEVRLNPQLRAPRARTLTLTLAKGLAQTLAFQPAVIMTLMSRV